MLTICFAEAPKIMRGIKDDIIGVAIGIAFALIKLQIPYFL